MIKACSLKRMVVYYIFPFLLISAATQASADRNEAANNCTIESAADWMNVDLNKSENKSIDIMGESTEGGSAELYMNDGVISSVKAKFYGETGKLHVNYYFNPANPKTEYLVEIYRYRYSKPMYIPEHEIAAISTHKFVVCEDDVRGYPDKNELKEEYKRVSNILASIRKLLIKPNMLGSDGIAD